jgi:tetratricopeptide (TPR) repeat protein
MKNTFTCRCAADLLISASARKLLSLFAAFVFLHPFVRAADAVPPGVEKAILSEDWKQVALLLPGVETNGASATLRLIKGQACLALNRNNESLRLFVGATAKADLEGYDAWAASFSALHPDRPIASYLKGDALARLGKWNQALVAFNDALKLSPHHSLSLNARGVLFARKGDFDNAGEDFRAAAAANPRLADPVANQGFRLLQMKAGAQSAASHFTNAIGISSNSFALAEFGKGCAFFALGDWGAAAKICSHSATNLDADSAETSRLILAMDAFVNDKATNLSAIVAKGDSDEDIGTTLQRRFTDVAQAQQWNANLDLRQNSADQMQRIQDLRQNSADQMQRIQDLRQNSADQMQRISEVRQNIEDQLQRMQPMQNSLGGVTSKPAHTRIEDPKAYFGPDYGLRYPANTEAKQ